ncbi:DUF6671 family protein [Cesiribacter andamanensis]|uniref:DUF6671 domain-containing protein n=1 Tax=Cesiribacter andamanensis AMV16 TaxID=1279009 RepID=M7N3C2_9BACT|nr:DUF6671 family protein [Cesiribacter andamanensis]EMR01762.1 hypothetical protein ADICEAN_03121 [Cesiribacter andamanensis AMV16]
MRWALSVGRLSEKIPPLATARAKCLQAMEMYGCDLGIASEGSFGAHPQLPLLPANQEWLICIDKKLGWECWAQTLSLETNFDAAEIAQEEQLRAFARRAGFPEHGLILRASRSDTSDICKGITSWQQLEEGFGRMLHRYGRVFVETDMRALYNPSRMKVIEEVGQKLLQQILTPCPGCSMPGYSLRQVVPGLPCRHCLTPSHSALYHVYSCQSCGYQHRQQHPQGVAYEEPMYCQKCNP